MDEVIQLGAHTDDSLMADVPLTTPTPRVATAGKDYNLGHQLVPAAENRVLCDIEDPGSSRAKHAVAATPSPRGKARGEGANSCDSLSSGRSTHGTGAPRWLSLPPRRPHPAWAAAERAIATSPLANRASR
ncbi:hypothetical protein SEPCBS119000_002872 [Sporothrix epigloea]|uniref:Uncharacterized protein n=1 Tax=Sporothrix epigloea TaxID=1892477 RepID=A0ABP0DMQ0_9PEZI